MARTDPQVNFRMPQELRDKLEDASKENKRTLTAEIVARLESSFEPHIVESEFQAGSTVTHTTVDGQKLERAVEEASERGTEKVIRQFFQYDEALEASDFKEYFRRILLELDKLSNRADGSDSIATISKKILNAEASNPDRPKTSPKKVTPKK